MSCHIHYFYNKYDFSFFNLSLMLNLQSLCQKMQHCIGDWFAFVKKTNVIYDIQSFAHMRTTWLCEYLVQNERKKKVKKENQLQTTMYIMLKSSFTIPLRGKSAWFAKLCLIFSSFWDFFYRLHCYACSWQQVTVFMRVTESFNQPIYSKMLIHSGMEQVSDSLNCSLTNSIKKCKIYSVKKLFF